MGVITVTINPGEEFRIKATPSPELMRKLAYLAAQDNDSVLTDGIRSGKDFGAGGRRTGRAQRSAQLAQLLMQQMLLLTDRLDALDRASEKALREAEERLAEIRRTANRTKDGRVAFADEDGTIYDEHGNEVSPDEIDPETWKADAPTWHDLKEAQKQQREAQQFRDKVEEQKDRLFGGELSDDDLADLEKEITALEKAVPAGFSRPASASQETTTRSTSAAKGYATGSALETDAILRDPFIGAVANASPAAESNEGVTPQPVAPLIPR